MQKNLLTEELYEWQGSTVLTYSALGIEKSDVSLNTRNTDVHWYDSDQTEAQKTRGKM